jgi:diguanylate cyclase (GGDEF)-like protein/PAS domain S-box-containing protein
MISLSPGPAALPLLVVAASIFTLGIVVVARERVSAVTLSFFALTVIVSLWLAPVSLMMMVTREADAFVLARIAYIGVALIPAAVLQFTLALIGSSRRHARALITAWGGGLMFATMFTTSRFLLSGTWRYSWGFYPRLTEASVLFLAYFALLLATALVALGKSREQSDRENKRNQSFFVALAIGYLGCVDYLPAYGIDFYPIGCVAIFAFVVLVARTSMRYRLMDFSPSFIAERLLQTMHSGVVVVDMKGHIRLANNGAARLLGSSPDGLRNVQLQTLLGLDRLPITDSESFNRRRTSRDRIMRWQRLDGTPLEVTVTASAICDENDNQIGVLYALADVSATHDFVTTLPNRSRFLSSFEEAKARMIAAGRIPALFFIDLDGFKAVNDQHGHAAGDALLRMVSQRIRNCMRGEDVLARYAGDEFVVLADMAKLDDATFVAAKLLRIISEPYTIDDVVVRVGASIGAAFFPTDGTTAEALLRAADAAMYGAKRAGKGRVQIRTTRTDVQAPPPYGVDARG